MVRAEDSRNAGDAEEAGDEKEVGAAEGTVNNNPTWASCRRRAWVYRRNGPRFSGLSMMAIGQMASEPRELWPSKYTMRRPMKVVVRPPVTTLQ